MEGEGGWEPDLREKTYSQVTKGKVTTFCGSVDGNRWLKSLKLGRVDGVTLSRFVELLS